MRRHLHLFAACLAVAIVSAFSVAQASASTLEDTTAKAALVAVYGNPGSNGAEVPVGGGLGRNFGFGANLLFQACEKCTTVVGKNLSVTVGGVALEAGDTFLGGTLLSNKTPATSPVSFGLTFVDFQQSTANKEPAATFTDTWDRPWVGELCGKEATCKVDPRGGGAGAHLCKFENVSFNVGPGTVVQGTVWCKWVNGTAEKAPCIELTEPPLNEETKFDTLYETQGAVVGGKAEKVKGTACLVSAQNNYYTVNATELKHDVITLE